MDIIGLLKRPCSDCGEMCYVNGVSGQKLKLHNVFLPNDRRILEGTEAYVPHFCGACTRCGQDPNATAGPSIDVAEIAEEVLIAFARDVGMPGLAELPLEQLRAALVDEVLRLKQKAKPKTPERKRRELAAEDGGRCPHGVLPEACEECVPVKKSVRARRGKDPA